MILNIFKCPECKSELEFDSDKYKCTSCNAIYNVQDRLFNFLPDNPNSNDFGMDYIEHYTVDGEIFDYFEERECKATEHDERRLREYILSKITGRNNSILDVGSGSAWVARELSQDNTVISFDISKDNVQKALKEINNDNHYGVIGDALNAPFKYDTFDYIISSEVIEHVVKPDLFVQELGKYIKKDGRLIISTPYKEKLHYSQCIHCNKMTPKNAHLHSFDENILQKFAGSDLKVSGQYIFGNKALIMLRAHIILGLLPLVLWKIIDSFTNVLVPKKSHIIMEYQRNGNE